MLLRNIAKTFLITLIIFSVSGCIALREGRVVLADDDKSVSVVFSDRDCDLINNYYHNKKKRKRMPPGLAKRDRLPPGLEKQVRKRGQLPPGLQGRDLPYRLESRLSNIPNGYVRIQVGGDIVLMNKKTRVVIDIIKDIAL